MRRIRMPAPDRDTVAFLIRNHLELSVAMRSRDLADPKAIHDVAQIVGTEDRLKALTVLTYADISAVNPNVMTPWRSSQLWRLYLAVYRELTRELAAERIAESASGPGAELLEGLPVRYLRTHSEEEIAEHVALAVKSEARGVAVDIRSLESAWQLTVITGDRPGLFARMAGTLAGFGMNILHAEAFSNRRGQVLDTFIFADPTRTLELNPSEVDRLRATAERVILGKLDVRELLRNRPKPKPPSRKVRVPAAIRFRRRGERHGHAGRNRGRGSPRPALRPGVGDFLQRRQHRSGADRHAGASRHRRVLRDGRRQETDGGGGNRRWARSCERPARRCELDRIDSGATLKEEPKPWKFN
jgi:[protein-PII] uridylyltransferase